MINWMLTSLSALDDFNESICFYWTNPTFIGLCAAIQQRAKYFAKYFCMNLQTTKNQTLVKATRHLNIQQQFNEASSPNVFCIHLTLDPFVKIFRGLKIYMYATVSTTWQFRKLPSPLITWTWVARYEEPTAHRISFATAEANGMFAENTSRSKLALHSPVTYFAMCIHLKPLDITHSCQSADTLYPQNKLQTAFRAVLIEFNHLYCVFKYFATCNIFVLKLRRVAAKWW